MKESLHQVGGRLVTLNERYLADFHLLCSLCRHGKNDQVKEALDSEEWIVPINYQDELGNHLMHVAAQNGNKRVIKLLLLRGADINIQNDSGMTARHFAYGYGYKDIGDYLLDHGAKDTLVNKEGLTPYAQAKAWARAGKDQEKKK